MTEPDCAEAAVADMLLRITSLIVGRRASGFVLVA